MGSTPDEDRRTVLRAMGATVAAAATGAGGVVTATESARGEAASWQSVTSPVDATLTDVETTAANDFAVGGGGVVIERTADGWTKVVDGGPTGNGNGLLGADVTDDGKRLWFVGKSGAIGEYDVETGGLNDHSAPNDVTNNFNDVSVTGTAGDANVYVGGDSGSVYYSFENGASGTWNNVSVGQGAAVQAIDFYDTRSGHLVNGNANAFTTTDGTTWERIGIADADVSLYGVDSNAADDVWVAAGGGVVYHYRPDAEGTLKWFDTKIGEPALRDLELESGDGYAVGDGGAVFDRANGTWSRDETPSGQNLTAVVDQSANDIAVGSGGTIIATDPDASASDPSSGQSGDAARIARVDTNTSGSKTLTFTVENTGDESVTVTDWALTTNVQVETIERSGAEVTLAADPVAGSKDGFPVDSTSRPFDHQPTLAAGERGSFDFGQYDGGNVALTVEPASDRPDGNFIGASFTYGDGTMETFYFAVTNVNS